MPLRWFFVILVYHCFIFWVCGILSIDDASPSPSISDSPMTNTLASEETALKSNKLRKEIAALESDILNLERYLLLLYRTLLHERESSSSCKLANDEFTPPPPNRRQAVARNIFHLPHPRSQQNGSASARRSLAEHFRVDIPDTPVALSQSIVKCISSIYRRSGANVPSSRGRAPNLFFKQCSTVADREASDLDSVSFEVRKICLDGRTFEYATVMFKRFQSLVRELEKVDPLKMKREEKLAFWINIHNSLIMHAYLAYGTEISARAIVCSKAAYNVGGLHVTANVIEQSILGLHRNVSERRIKAVFLTAKKQTHVYALDYPEPLVYFALSTGAHTDPPVGVYGTDGVFKDLREAKEEYIRCNVWVKGSKIWVPKIVDVYAKDMSMDFSGMMEMISGCISGVQLEAVLNRFREKPHKCVHWREEILSFRFLLRAEMEHQ